MKAPVFIIFLLFAAVAGPVISIILNSNDPEKIYIPRDIIDSEGQDVSRAIEWLNQRRNNLVTGTIDINDIISAREQVEYMRQTRDPKAVNLEWDELGPDNIGGRTRAILVDRDNPNVIYAGGVAGGLWRSTTNTQSWEKVNDHFDNLGVVSLCQAADGDMYFGTGEGMYTNSGSGTGGIQGQGIWKSTDHGATFNRLESTWADAEAQSTFVNVNKLAADPVNPERIYAATRRGLRVSDNGGEDWHNPINATGSTAVCSDVKVASDGAVVISLNNQCWVSPDGNDDTFEKHYGSTGSDQIASSQRLEFAFAPSDPNYIYCQSARFGGTVIYQSKDQGATWSVIGQGDNGSSFNPLGNQGTYDNVIAVFPDNREKVIVGGQYGLWLGTGYDGDFGWEQLTMWNLYSTHPLYVHADQHAIIFHPTTNVMYIGSDGGISRSVDGAQSFQTMNRKYNVTQFYSVGFARTGEVIGGTQDNGSLFINFLGNTPQTAINVSGGDGGYAEISTICPDVGFTTVYGAKLYKYTLGSNSGSLIYSSPTGGAFVTPLALWESFNDINSTDTIEFIAQQDYDTGDTIDYTSLTGYHLLHYILDQPLYAGESVKIHDVYQSVLAIGINGNIQVSRNVLYHSSGTWHSIINPDDISVGTISEMAFSKDGNILYSASGGTIYRSTGLLYARSYNYESTDTTYTYEQDYSEIESIDSTAVDSVFIDVEYTITGFEIDTTYIIDTIADPPDTIEIIIDTTYLYDVDYIYEYTYEYDTTYGWDTTMNVSPITVNVNTYNTVEIQKIGSWSNRTITGIAVDPQDPENVIVTLGNYGNSYFVYYSTNAASTTSTSASVNFSSRQGNLPQMPVFSAVIECQDQNMVIVGTEYGVYLTEDITVDEPVWTDQNAGGLANVPVHMIRQQTFPNGWNSEAEVHTGVTNHGFLYIGTHGRGIFKSETLKGPVSIDEDPAPVQLSFDIEIFPNPVRDNATVTCQLTDPADLEIKIYDLQGRMVLSKHIDNSPAGQNSITMDMQGLKQGAYIIRVDTGNLTCSRKFVKL